MAAGQSLFGLQRFPDRQENLADGLRLRGGIAESVLIPADDLNAAVDVLDTVAFFFEIEDVAVLRVED